MNTKPTQFLALSAALSAASLARAQPFAITWSTIDGGGTTTPAVGGSFTVVGTAGQPDAGSHSGGAFTCLGGFWAVTASGGACYPNCDASTVSPVLNVNDFTCFLNRYAASDPYANCDASTSAPLLNVNDFTCFLNRYAAGCP
jgi:hypothetical protein